MNRHPGREEQTIHLLKSIELKKGMKALDLGAGEGETVRIMKAFGLNVQEMCIRDRELTGTAEKSCGHLSNLSGTKYYSFIY